MTGTRNVGIGVSTVEWVRAHRGNGLASRVEDWYYTLTAPEPPEIFHRGVDIVRWEHGENSSPHVWLAKQNRPASSPTGARGLPTPPICCRKCSGPRIAI